MATLPRPLTSLESILEAAERLVPLIDNVKGTAVWPEFNRALYTLITMAEIYVIDMGTDCPIPLTERVYALHGVADDHGIFAE